MSRQHKASTEAKRGGGKTKKDEGLSEKEKERRRQVSKITPAKALRPEDFLQQYDTKYKDESTDEEGEDDESTTSEESEPEDDEDIIDRQKESRRQRKKKKRQKILDEAREALDEERLLEMTTGIKNAGNDDEESGGEKKQENDVEEQKTLSASELREEKEIEELMQMARDLEGASVIEVRYEKLMETRAKRIEKRRLDALNASETCWEAFCRIICCRPRRGTVPSLKEQRRFLVDVKNEMLPAVKKALSNFQPPDFAEEDGKTALYSAAFTGNVGLAHMLMDFDADPEVAENEKSMCPLHMAALGGFEDFVEVLTSRGAKVDVRDVEGRTPLMYAAMKGHVEVIMTLLDAGTNLKATDKKGWTALHYAAWKGHLLAIDHLERAGAFADALDRLKMSPFDYAVEAGQETAARMLAAMERGKYERADFKRELYPNMDHDAKPKKFGDDL